MGSVGPAMAGGMGDYTAKPPVDQLRACGNGCRGREDSGPDSDRKGKVGGWVSARRRNVTVRELIAENKQKKPQVLQDLGQTWPFLV